MSGLETFNIYQGSFRIDGGHKTNQAQLLAAGFELLVSRDLGKEPGTKFSSKTQRNI